MVTSALLVIDFINDIVHPDGKIANTAEFVKQHQVIAKANEAIQFAREQNFLLLFVKVGFTVQYLECPKNSPIFGKAKQFQALQLHSWGTEFHHELAINPQDAVIIKHRVNAFYGTDLETFLRANQVERLYLCGVSTDMAIQTTARDAHDRDYQVIIIEDACGAANQEIHENTLKSLARIAEITNLKTPDKFRYQ